jgi:hypothetical protein
VPVFRASLPREHDELFCATPVSVDISKYLKACMLKFAQAEVGDFQPGAFLRSNYDAR